MKKKPRRSEKQYSCSRTAFKEPVKAGRFRALREVNADKSLFRDLARMGGVGGKEYRFRASFDPGVRGTGMALWEESEWSNPKDLPIVVTSFDPPSSMKWHEAMYYVMDGINSVLCGYGTSRMTRLYIELPQFFGASAKGEASAASGDLIKLTSMAGMIMSWGWHADCKVKTYTPNEWKGQLPKQVCHNRILDILPGLEPMAMGGMTSHGWDAVGVGLYAKGLF